MIRSTLVALISFSLMSVGAYAKNDNGKHLGQNKEKANSTKKKSKRKKRHKRKRVMVSFQANGNLKYVGEHTGNNASGITSEGASLNFSDDAVRSSTGEIGNTSKDGSFKIYVTSKKDIGKDMIRSCRQKAMDNLQNGGAPIMINLGAVRYGRVYYSIRELVRREIRKRKRAMRKEMHNGYKQLRREMKKARKWNRGKLNAYKAKSRAKYKQFRKSLKKLRKELREEFKGKKVMRHRMWINIDKTEFSCDEAV